MPRTIRITWHGHSCFTIDNGTHILALDPYDSGMIGYPPLKIQAHAMLASHGHGDHNYRAAIRFLAAPEPVLQQVAVIPDQPVEKESAIFLIQAVETHHDESGGSKRGQNTVHIILANGLRIVHLGDLGHVLAPGQAAAIGRPDLLMIPVGGYYTIDAAAARAVIDQLKPANIVPMHYQIGFGNLPIAKVEPFLNLLADTWQINRLAESFFDLTGQTGNQCCVCHYQSDTRNKGA